MNAKLLEDDKFTALVRDEIKKIANGEKLAYGVQSGIFKQDIKMKALERASAIKYDQRKNEMWLRNSIHALLREDSRLPGAFKDDISSLKDKLEILDLERYSGAIVRARVIRWATGEAPTQRALSLEKKYARRNEITEVDRDGAVTRDKDKIELFFPEYYSRLFEACSVDVERFKEEFVCFMPRVNGDTKEFLQSPITVDDVLLAIEAPNPGKSAGPDGLSAAFYKALNREIVPLLASVFNEAYDIECFTAILYVVPHGVNPQNRRS